jgi:hypothetical protein
MTDACEEFTIANTGDDFNASEVFGDVLATPVEPKPKETAVQKSSRKVDIKEVKEYTESKKASPEEVVERQSLLLKLNRYATSNRFSEYLKDMGFDLHAKTLAKKSRDELDELMIEVQTTVNAKSSSNIFLQATVLGANVLEGVTQNPNIKPRIDLSGFTASINEDQELLDAIEAVALEYGSLCMMTPPMKMMYCLLANGARVSAINKVKAQIALQFQRQADSLRPVVIETAVETTSVSASEPSNTDDLETIIPLSAVTLENKPLPPIVRPISDEQPLILNVDYNIDD